MLNTSTRARKRAFIWLHEVTSDLGKRNFSRIMVAESGFLCFSGPRVSRVRICEVWVVKMERGRQYQENLVVA